LFSKFFTLTIEPKGKFLCAAVSFLLSNISPLAVGLPSKSFPYQDAIPISSSAVC